MTPVGQICFRKKQERAIWERGSKLSIKQQLENQRYIHTVWADCRRRKTHTVLSIELCWSKSCSNKTHTRRQCVMPLSRPEIACCIVRTGVQCAVDLQIIKQLSAWLLDRPVRPACCGSHRRVELRPFVCNDRSKPFWFHRLQKRLA